MGIDRSVIIITIINLLLIIAIVTGIIKVIQSVNNFINRNKEMDKKLDIILKKIDEKDK